MKIFPASAYKGPMTTLPVGEMLRDVGFCRSVIALLLLRLGEQQLIAQADLDLVAGLYIFEGVDDQGHLVLDLGSTSTPPEKQQ